MIGSVLRRLVIALAMFFCSGTAFAAEECQYNSEEAYSAMTERLKAALTCQDAHERHMDCAWGSSADAGFAAIVIEKCESSFLPRLTSKQRRSYKVRFKHCDDESAHEGGTIAIANAAVCREEVAVAFAEDAAVASRAKLPPAAPAKASFDCRKAEKPLERVICSSDDIGAADIALSKAYGAASRSAAPDVRAVLTASERGWLDFVATKCGPPPDGGTAGLLTRACVQNAFEVRLAQIGPCLAKIGNERGTCLNSYTILRSELPK